MSAADDDNKSVTSTMIMDEDDSYDSDSAYGDVDLINSMIQASRSGDMNALRELSRDAEPFHLNWALSVCESINVAKFIVMERQTHDTLSSCYMQAIRKKNQELVDFVENVDDEDIIKTLLDDCVEEFLTILCEEDSLGSLESVISLSAKRFGSCPLEDADKEILSNYERSKNAVLELVKTKLPGASLKYQKMLEEEEAESDTDDL